MIMLTDKEIWDCYQHSNGNTGYPKAKSFARAVIAAYENKLREQEPVAEVIDDFNGWTKVRMYKAMCCDTKLFSHPAPIPEGYALVPIEPTETMIIALVAKVGSGYGVDYRVRAGYKAMLAAARSGE